MTRIRSWVSDFRGWF